MDKSPKFVVTLPANAEPNRFALEASDSGADLLELRSDLLPVEIPLEEISRTIKLLIARRTDRYLPDHWISAATFVDQDISLPHQPIDVPTSMKILSFHANRRMDEEEIVKLWKEHCREGEAIKYIEPYDTDSEQHLIRVRQLLDKFSDRVTVLPMGKGSSNIRRNLASGNYLHYCTLHPDSYSAPGQALLSDEIAYFKAGSAGDN